MITIRRSTFRTKSNRRSSKPAHGLGFRHPRFETLESRQLLTVSLPAITDYSVPVLAPVPVELLGSDSDGDKLTYSVTSSNPSLVQPILTSSSNPVVKMTVAGYGDMKFQLYQDLVPDAVNRFLTLVNNKRYDNQTIYRIQSNFVIQGGLNSSSSSAPQFDDQFDANLRFTRRGVLAMANRGSDTNTSEFFITDVYSARFLDQRYTIIGFLTEGENVRAALQAKGSSSNMGMLTTPITLTSISVVPNAQSAVLLLKSLQVLSGSPSANVTVTVSDGKEAPVSRTFKVTPVVDTDPSSTTGASYNDPPYIPKMNPIQTTVNTAIEFDIPSVDIDKTSATVLTYSAKLTTTNSSITVTVDTATGHVKVTPTGGVTGVFGLQLGVNDGSIANVNEDTQVVPLYIYPAAPSAVTLLTKTKDEVTTDRNNDGNNLLKFRVAGVSSGNKVTIYADGNAIGSAYVSLGADTVEIETNGTLLLPNGAHTITARQVLTPTAVTVGNSYWSSLDLQSATSAATTITIDHVYAAPVLTVSDAVTIVAGGLVTGTATATDDDLPYDKLTFSLGTDAPYGATIDPTTGAITWATVELDAARSQPVSIPVVVTDSDGLEITGTQHHSVTKNFNVTVTPIDRAPVFTADTLPGTVTQGSTVSGRIQAVDRDLVNAHAVDYALLNAPAGMTIDAQGNIAWSVPANSPVGAVQFTVRATERSTAALSATYGKTITVHAVASVSAPVFVAPATTPTTPSTTRPTTSNMPVIPTEQPTQPASGGQSLGGQQLGDNGLLGSSSGIYYTSGSKPARKIKPEPGEEGKDKQDTSSTEHRSKSDAEPESAALADAALAALAEEV